MEKFGHKPFIRRLNGCIFFEDYSTYLFSLELEKANEYDLHADLISRCNLIENDLKRALKASEIAENEFKNSINDLKTIHTEIESICYTYFEFIHKYIIQNYLTNESRDYL